jgi:hypothetical protein
MGAKPRSDGTPPSVAKIAAYKAILRECIERRPAGMRARIARALGTHKSFVSQLVNPIYPMPIPAQHLETILSICHFSPEERRKFLKAYARAHPRPTRETKSEQSEPKRKSFVLEIPALDDPVRQLAFESFLRDLAERALQLFDNIEEPGKKT